MSYTEKQILRMTQSQLEKLPTKLLVSIYYSRYLKEAPVKTRAKIVLKKRNVKVFAYM